MTNEIPITLYKYRSFNDQFLSSLLGNQIYFSDPAFFNDPLDCAVRVHCDIPLDRLRGVLNTLIERRMKASLKKEMEYWHQKGRQKIDSQQVDYEIDDEKEYISSAAEWLPDSSVTEDELITDFISLELKRIYNHGIYSLSERRNCPAMWGHYAYNHRGICLGYSIPKELNSQLIKVEYGGNRAITASTVESWLNGNCHSKKQIDISVLGKKSKEWDYEKEWRLTGTAGSGSSLLNLTEVIFGIRCPQAVKFAIFKSLSSRRSPPNYFDIQETDSFELEVVSIDTNLLERVYDRCSENGK